MIINVRPSYIDLRSLLDMFGVLHLIFALSLACMLNIDLPRK